MRRKVGGIGGNSGCVRGPSLAPPRGQNRLRPRGCGCGGGGGGDNDFIIISVIIEERERGRINMVGPSVPPSVVRRPQKKSFAHFERERRDDDEGELINSALFTVHTVHWMLDGRLGTSLASRNLSRSLGSFIAHHLISVHAVAFLFAMTPSPIGSHSPFSFCDAKLSSLDRTQEAELSYHPFTARLRALCTSLLELCPQTVVERASERAVQ